jgi:hypothetical protein
MIGKAVASYSILLADLGRYDDAIGIAEWGVQWDIDDGTKSGMKGRIERLQKQKAKAEAADEQPRLSIAADSCMIADTEPPTPISETPSKSAESRAAISEPSSKSRVPPCSETNIEVMSKNQRRFCNHLKKEILADRFPAIDGQIAYLQAVAYQTAGEIARKHITDSKGFCDALFEFLTVLKCNYRKEIGFTYYCDHWIADCLLILKRYEEYLGFTKGTDESSLIQPDWSRDVNTRCNITVLLGHDLDPLDILRLTHPDEARITPIAREHAVGFIKCFRRVVAEERETHGPWADRLRMAWPDGQETCPAYPLAEFTPYISVVAADDIADRDWTHEELSEFLENGPGSVEHLETCLDPGIRLQSYFPRGQGLDEVNAAMREAENRLREELGVPRVGEGWISETELFHTVREAFPAVEVFHHGQPEWLGRQHLDVWIPEWRIGIEYQGRQHFEPVEFFGGEEAFKATQARDAKKRELCGANNVTLIEVTAENTPEQVIEWVQRASPN